MLHSFHDLPENIILQPHLLPALTLCSVFQVPNSSFPRHTHLLSPSFSFGHLPVILRSQLGCHFLEALFSSPPKGCLHIPLSHSPLLLPLLGLWFARDSELSEAGQGLPCLLLCPHCLAQPPPCSECPYLTVEPPVMQVNEADVTWVDVGGVDLLLPG